MMLPKLGIIAGGGELPAEIINHCQATGRDYFVVALKDQANSEHFIDIPHEWVRLGAAGKSIRILRQNNVEELVLAGSVKRPSLSALRPDIWTAKFFARTGAVGLGDDGLLSALISALQEHEGFRVIGTDDLLPNLITKEGVIGSRTPLANDYHDIALGIQAAKELGAQDIGQAVIVRGGEVIGREDQNGTDALLRTVRPIADEERSGVLVKTAKPGQERRADLPTVGPETINGVYSAGLAGIALEAGNALILDRARVIQLADSHNLFVIGVAANGDDDSL
jgi:UDP-2,3-diacylglucosamine hydrolase